MMWSTERTIQFFQQRNKQKCTYSTVEHFVVGYLLQLAPQMLRVSCATKRIITMEEHETKQSKNTQGGGR